MSPVDPIEDTRRALLAEGAVLCIRLGPERSAPLEEIARSAVRGGLRALELTLTTEGALDAMRALSADEQALVGGGTVLTPDDVKAVAEAGGRFVFSPVFDPAVVEAARSRGLLAVPGAATPSEIWAAWRHGVPFVKVFPSGPLGGPDYLRAVRGPLPDVPLVPTSGPTAANAAEYFAAGATLVGVGAEVVAAERSPDEIEAAAARVRAAVDAARAGLKAPSAARIEVTDVSSSAGALCQGLTCRWEGGQYVAIVAPAGLVACGIFDPDVCERFGFAVAMAHGTPERPLVAPADVLAARVDRVSSAARARGIEPGMTGAEALERMVGRPDAIPD